MKKIGNLFFLAEKQLIKEKKEGIIPCYTLADIIEYAIMIRKFLDHNPKRYKKLMQLTKEQLKKYKKFLRKQKYLKTGW